MGKKLQSLLFAALCGMLPARSGLAQEPLPSDEPKLQVVEEPKPGHFRGNLQVGYGRGWRFFSIDGDRNFEAYDRSSRQIWGGLQFDGFYVGIRHAEGLSTEERQRDFTLTDVTLEGDQSYTGTIGKQEVTVRDSKGNKYTVDLEPQEITINPTTTGNPSSATVRGTQQTERDQISFDFGMRFLERYGQLWAASLYAQIPAGLDIQHSRLVFSSGDKLPSKLDLDFLLGIEARGEAVVHLPSRWREYVPLAFGISILGGYVVDRIGGDNAEGGVNLAAMAMIKMWPPRFEGGKN